MPSYWRSYVSVVLGIIGRERCIVGCMRVFFVSFMNTVVLTVLLVKSVV